MELKQVINIEIKKDDHNYIFSMPVGASFGEVYDVVFQVLSKVTDLANEAVKKAKPQEPEETKAELAN